MAALVDEAGVPNTNLETWMNGAGEGVRREVRPAD